MDKNRDCPRCQVSMELGFQVDDVQRSCYRQAQWAPGPPKTDDSQFLGMKMYEDWLLEIDKETLKPIFTFRCPECGLLENYAP